MVHPKDNKQQEISHASLLSFLLNREDFADVKLQGNDGAIQVDANRFVLARSPVLRTMLLDGQFQETDAPVVKFDFASAVLRAVVEYCYTDTAKILDGSASAKTLVSLMEAADFFGLDGLVEKTKEEAFQLQPISDIALAFEFFQACKTAGPVAAEIEALALDTIRNAPLLVEGLNNDILASIDSSALECILKDDKMQVNEKSMFLLLNAWAGAPGGEAPERREEARRLVQYIHLKKIAPQDLALVVEPSGLVTTEELKEARESQTLRHEPAAFDRPRFTPPTVWTRSRTALFLCGMDKLVCPPMRSGIHHWKIQVEAPAGTLSCELGVMLSSEELPPAYFGPIGHRGWGLFSCGRSYHNNRFESRPNIHVSFGNGSIVTTILDLRPGKGTLSASVDDGDTYEIFNNMLEVEEVSSIGLVPAAFGSVTVRFLGFDRTLA